MCFYLHLVEMKRIKIHICTPLIYIVHGLCSHGKPGNWQKIPYLKKKTTKVILKHIRKAPLGKMVDIV